MRIFNKSTHAYYYNVLWIVWLENLGEKVEAMHSQTTVSEGQVSSPMPQFHHSCLTINMCTHPKEPDSVINWVVVLYDLLNVCCTVLDTKVVIQTEQEKEEVEEEKKEK